MKKIILFLLVGILNFNLLANVNGHLEEIDGKQVLTVWGTHQERGYAHGYLLGAKIKNVFNEYLINYVCRGSSTNYNTLLSVFTNYFTVEEKYQIEAESMLQGLIDSGVDPRNEIIDRDINKNDILFVTAFPDIVEIFFNSQGLQLGCSSMSSWGTSTQQDSSLAGHLIITRLMDWSAHTSLYSSHLMIVNIPSEPDEQKCLTIGFCGLLGALSGINESGIASFMNVGNVHTYDTDELAYPTLFSIRNGLEAKDYNQDTYNTEEDIVQAVKDRNRLSGSIIHVVKDNGSYSSPTIIECNNEKGVIERKYTENTVVSGENLVATNHFRLLYEPEDCYRYSGIVDSLSNSTQISPARSWSIMQHAAGHSGTIHAIQYIPYKQQLKWVGTNSSVLAHNQEPTVFDLNTLFSYHTGIDNHLLVENNRFSLHQNYPNPFNASTTIKFDIAKASVAILSIYNINGQCVAELMNKKLNAGNYSVQWDANDYSSGVYWYKLTAGNQVITRKCLLLK